MFLRAKRQFRKSFPMNQASRRRQVQLARASFSRLHPLDIHEDGSQLGKYVEQLLHCPFPHGVRVFFRHFLAALAEVNLCQFVKIVDGDGLFLVLGALKAPGALSRPHVADECFVVDFLERTFWPRPRRYFLFDFGLFHDSLHWRWPARYCSTACRAYRGLPNMRRLSASSPSLCSQVPSGSSTA